MKYFVFILFILALILVLYWGINPMLSTIGKALIVHTSPVPSKAAVVLNTDQEYYSRLLEAAQLYKAGLVKTIILNGDRKTEAFKQIEADGFTRVCAWSGGFLPNTGHGCITGGNNSPKKIEELCLFGGD